MCHITSCTLQPCVARRVPVHAALHCHVTAVRMPIRRRPSALLRSLLHRILQRRTCRILAAAHAIPQLLPHAVKHVLAHFVRLDGPVEVGPQPGEEYRRLRQHLSRRLDPLRALRQPHAAHAHRAVLAMLHPLLHPLRAPLLLLPPASLLPLWEREPRRASPGGQAAIAPAHRLRRAYPLCPALPVPSPTRRHALPSAAAPATLAA